MIVIIVIIILYYYCYNDTTTTTSTNIVIIIILLDPKVARQSLLVLSPEDETDGNDGGQRQLQGGLHTTVSNQELIYTQALTHLKDNDCGLSDFVLSRFWLL